MNNRYNLVLCSGVWNYLKCSYILVSNFDTIPVVSGSGVSTPLMLFLSTQKYKRPTRPCGNLNSECKYRRNTAKHLPNEIFHSMAELFDDIFANEDQN